MKFARILIVALLSLLVNGRLHADGTTDKESSVLYINEIQVTNIDMFIDPSVNYGGWIELYNPTDTRISIVGYFISDDPYDLRKWKLPAGSGGVPANGYKNLWFDHYDTGNKYSNVAYRQIPFKLQYEGGAIYLSDTSGNLVASMTYPPAVLRCSYARLTDGSDDWGYTATPTPEASNDGSTFASVQLDPPVVNRNATVFKTPFTFHVSIPKGATLRYTTDGSTPTLNNSRVSTNGAFTLSNRTSIYRFRLFQDGYLPSAVVTRTFIYKDRDYYLPIVSVVTDEHNLYDNEIGCYTIGTNGISGQGVSYNTNRNRSWERPVNFEYLVPDEEGDGGSFLMALNQECDFEVCGGWSRNQYAPNASFRLKSNKYYLGQNFLPYPFFKDKPFIKSKSVVIRNGGNNGYSRLKDAAIHAIIIRSGFHVDCQATQPAHIFINGAYQFMFNVREPNHKHHGYSNYGIDTDEMDQFEINSVQGYVQKTGDNVAFRQWMSLATALGKDPTNDDLYHQICELVDIDEYCNYMAAECYVGCGDWLTNSNNVKGYRSRNDGKFHLIFMDLDSGFGSTSMISSLAGRRSDSRYDTGKNFLIDIFLNMLEYEPFRKQFIDAFCIVGGSVYEPEFVTSVVNSMRDNMYNAMSFDGRASDLSSSASSLISAITSTSNRNARVESVRSYFKLNSNDAYTLNLSSNIAVATLQVNGQEVPRNRFAGTLFAPATITARAPSGYRFHGWQLDQSSDAIANPTLLFDTTDAWDYYDQGSLDGEDWKAANYDTGAWSRSAGPFGYGNVGISGSADYATTLDYGSDSSKKRPTYYFRKVFYLRKEPTNEDVYQLTYYVDDGFVAYVNGTEIGRHLIDGTPSYSTYTTTYVGSSAATATITIPNELLRRGNNVIAVEVHNTSASSSDIFWGASVLHGTRLESSIISTNPELSLSDLETHTATLVATFDPLADEEQLADLAMPIKVNEVSAGNSVFINDLFKKNDWIELYNPTDTDIDAAGLYVSDNLNSPYKYQVPAGTDINTVVPAHGFLVLWADKLDDLTQLHTTFKLSNSDEEIVVITSGEEFVQANAAFFDRHPDLRYFSDALIYDAHAGDQSVGRYPDGSKDFYRMNRPTIAMPNSLRTYDVATGTDEGVGEIISVGIASATPISTATSTGYYTLSGIYAGNDLRRLPTGIYVCRLSDGSSQKVAIHRNQ